MRTGTVEYKQVSDDIRATGNVDIDERLVSYVQARFPDSGGSWQVTITVQKNGQTIATKQLRVNATGGM